MKRFVSLFTALCILFICTVAFADVHEDLENMTVEELESLIQEATQILEAKKSSSVSEGLEDGIESMDEGSTVIYDENFLKDFTKKSININSLVNYKPHRF